jgi:hypothetical protein
MKTKLESFLKEAEREHAGRILSFYSKHSDQFGRKSVDEIEAILSTLTTKACWFLEIASLTHTKCEKLGFDNKEALYKAVVELIKERNWKPATVLSLVKVIQPFNQIESFGLEEALSSLLSAKPGNSNARKRLSEEQEASIVAFWNSTGKIKTTYKLYCEKAKEMVAKGIWVEQPISLSVIKTLVKAIKAQPAETQIESSKSLKSIRESISEATNERFGMSEQTLLKRYSS